MLNEGKGIDGVAGTVASEGGEDTYSLVSEANGDGDASNGGVDAGNQSKEASDGANLGLLILEGLEADDDDTEEGEEEEEEEEEEEVEDSNQGTPLSIPDTVYLPSEVGSMGVVSGVTHEQNRHQGSGNADSRYHRVRDILREKWSLLLSSVPRWRAGAARSFNSTQLLPLLAMFMAFAAFTSWRSHVWRNEALRLGEELQQQRTLLLETQAQLEVMLEWNERKESDKSDFEGFFPRHKLSDDEAVLSFKNCYVEASISLGACSREWQRRWWSDTKSGGSRGPEDDEDDIFSYDDGFADDMHRLVTSFKDTVASKTTRSYSYVQKAMKELSYEGLKDTFTKDGYIQSILQFPPPEMNGTGDRTLIAAI